MSEKWRNIGETEKVKVLRYFSFAPRHVTYQVSVQLQVRCNCNVRMNTFYTWKLYSDINWNNVTHQVAMQLQVQCNCNVRMNTFYTWKVYSNIYWNNLETIALTVELRAWVKVIQYHWHNCKEKMSEKWRNIGENRKSEASWVFFICT